MPHDHTPLAFTPAHPGWLALYWTSTDQPGQYITEPLAGWLTTVLVEVDHTGHPYPPELQQTYYPTRRVVAARANPHTGRIEPVTRRPRFYTIIGPNQPHPTEQEAQAAWETWQAQQAAIITEQKG
jgi:hypothetical protein